jgi:hypothetical protein
MIHERILELIDQGKVLSPGQLTQLIGQVAVAPFTTELLEVDRALWGGFWHFDVIGPGYRLPAVELALLRAIRLDKDWPEETAQAQFLADLRQAISDPQAGVWSLKAAGAPCLIIVARNETMEVSLAGPGRIESSAVYHPVTVVWYCAATGQLHAGYRTGPGGLYFPAAIEQRAPQFKYKATGGYDRPSWAIETLDNRTVSPKERLAVRLDTEILRVRISEPVQPPAYDSK